ncbi:MAG TPA: hypothetical protein VIL92_09900 [Gaiellaceae bacterium]
MDAIDQKASLDTLIAGDPDARLLSRKKALLAGGAAAAAVAGGFMLEKAAPADATITQPFVIPAGFTNTDVQNAINTAVSSGQAVFLPAGTYTFTGSVTVNSPVTILSAAKAVINISSGVDGFIFTGGYNANGQVVSLPQLVGGNRQIRLLAVAVMNLYVGFCSGATVGISVESGSINSVATLDNTITFQFIQGCTYGIRLMAGSAPVQGTVINGNFITGCVHAIDFNATSTSQYFNDTIIDVAAVEGGGGSNPVGATGISQSGTQFINAPTTFRHVAFFDGFDRTVANSFINFPGNGNSFEIAFADYSKDNLSRIHIAGVGNRFRTLYNSQPALNASAIAAAANSPGISNFNGGIALNTTAARITCAMVALSANGFQDYYVYFSMLDGYSNNVRASIRNDGGYPFIVSIEDESFVPGNDGHSGAGQVHIRVRTPIATAATTVELFIQVML